MKRLLLSLMSLNFTLTASLPVISCQQPTAKADIFDLATINSEILTKHSWTIDQLLGASNGKFGSLRDHVLAIISQNLPQLDLLKIKADIYYGNQTTVNPQLLINFNDINNLAPIFNFTVHLTPSEYGHYQNEKWIHFEKNIDFSNLDVFKNATYVYNDHPLKLNAAELLTTFINNYNRIITSEAANLEIKTYLESQNLINNKLELPRNLFKINYQNYQENLTNYLTFKEDNANLVFNPTDKVLVQQELGAKGLQFHTTNFLTGWKVTTDGSDFNTNDWRYIDWKPLPKTYAKTTLVQDVIEDTRAYLAAHIAHVHNSHFLTSQDIKIVIKKSYQPNADDAWPLTTPLVNLWKTAEHGNLNYAYVWISKSNNSLLTVDNSKSVAGTHITFKIS
ncbi:hypothetical protein [Spiroplasma sp. DGKH1]|uniref:hypothetical protein n=1 Tax=Spiroplasma sp. DGKH1 TaxID=3050074 RepID=UPI0034C68FEE